jgi:hypothetical protein
MDEGVARVVQRALAYHAETLAWRAAEEDVDGPASYARVVANVFAVYVGDASADGRAIGKIKLVCGAVNGIVFHRRGDVESGLLEAQAQPSRSRKEIHAYWSFAVAYHREGHRSGLGVGCINMRFYGEPFAQSNAFAKIADRGNHKGFPLKPPRPNRVLTKAQWREVR